MPDVEPLSTAKERKLTNMALHLKGAIEVICSYKNWKGEVSERRFRMIYFWYGSTKWHPKPGPMLKAFDLEKQAERDFYILDLDFSTLRPVPPEAA